MGDYLMLHGVLNAPYPDDPKELGVVEWVQFRDRARQASAQLEAVTAERDAWKSKAQDLALTEIQRLGQEMEQPPASSIRDEALEEAKMAVTRAMYGSEVNLTAKEVCAHLDALKSQEAK